MRELLTTGNIIFVLTVVGVIFTVYSKFRDPDVQADKDIALLSQRTAAIEAWMQKLATNDLPHFDARIKDVHDDISSLKVGLAQVVTIIDERIPRRT